jgi:hypothetical protein
MTLDLSTVSLTVEHAADALNKHAVARLTDFSAYSAKAATIGA